MLACSLTFLSVLPQSTHAMYQFFSRFVKLSFRALAMMSATTTTHGKGIMNHGIMRGYHDNVSCFGYDVSCHDYIEDVFCPLRTFVSDSFSDGFVIDI